MPKFIIQELREITVETTVRAGSPAEALAVYKRSRLDINGKITEVSHITVESSKEEAQ